MAERGHDGGLCWLDRPYRPGILRLKGLYETMDGSMRENKRTLSVKVGWKRPPCGEYLDRWVGKV